MEKCNELTHSASLHYYHAPSGKIGLLFHWSKVHNSSLSLPQPVHCVGLQLALFWDNNGTRTPSMYGVTHAHQCTKLHFWSKFCLVKTLVSKMLLFICIKTCNYQEQEYKESRDVVSACVWSCCWLFDMRAPTKQGGLLGLHIYRKNLASKILWYNA